MSKVTVRPAGDADLAALFALRHEVFVLEQAVPDALERDEHDPVAEHVVAVDITGRVVGTGRVYREGAQAYGDRDVGHIGRVAVARVARGAGVGAALVRALEERAVALGCSAVVLGAQVPAVDFYRRLGYEPYGEVFDDAGLEHRWMRRRLDKAVIHPTRA